MLTEADIEAVESRYRREQDRYRKLAEVIYELCLEMVSEVDVRATVQRRAKDPISLRNKLRKIISTVDGRARFATADDVFSKMSDLAAVRISTYLESDRRKIVSKISEYFDLPQAEGVANPEAKEANAYSKHYRAIHCQVSLKVSDLEGANENLSGTTCEIQVCSMLAHVWNELEHDLAYKPTTGNLSEPEKDLLHALGNMVRSGDTIIKTLLDVNTRRLEAQTGEFQDIHDFVARLRRYFPRATKFGENANQLFEECLRLRLKTPEDVTTALGITDDNSKEAEGRDLVRQLTEFVSRRGESDRVVLNPDTSDVMAALLFEAKVDDVLSGHPLGIGLGRPSRLVYMANRYKMMRDR